MSNQSLNEFIAYIRSLCSAHVEIQHSDTQKHFIEIGSEQQLSAKSLHLPVVALDKLEITYKGQTDNYRKDRFIQILFLDKVSDPANYGRIKEVNDAMEAIAEDFVNKMREDRMLKKHDFLKCLIISEIQVVTVEQKNLNLYGAMMSFNFDLPYSGALTPGRFVS